MNRMRERRRALGLTMKQLGAIVGVSEGAISHYETGRREPDPDMLKSLASALGVSVDYILERDQDEQARNESTPALLTREERMLEMFRQMDEKEQDAFIKWLERR